MNGILIIDKPSGMTSHDVVVRIRRIVNRSVNGNADLPTGFKVGHAGTLDPLATGVLPILIGKATKLSNEVMGGEKEYIAELKFGEATDTDDSEGRVISSGECPNDLEGQLRAILPDFLGKTTQIPPKYSAIKKNGRPFYKIARKNEDFVPPPREIVINEIELLEVKSPCARIRVKCQKGTYIRALARDIGTRLGCFAHLTGLRRTLCGGFSLDDAVALDKVFTGQEISLVLRVSRFLK